jgi:hypothetical protein
MEYVIARSRNISVLFYAEGIKDFFLREGLHPSLTHPALKSDTKITYEESG